MRIEKIHPNKIKVTFDLDDMLEFNITPEAVKDNAPAVQRLLMALMRRAEAETGFSAENCRLMVEAMPTGDAMVMYITKITEDDDLKDIISSVKRRIRLKVKSAAANEEGCVLITFSSFDDAIALADFAADTDGGRLYFCNNKYHLVIERRIANRFSEFGRASFDEGLLSLVSEHGKLICENALKTLREHF